MKNRLEFKHEHRKGEIVRANVVKTKKKYVEAIGAELSCGGYACQTKDTRAMDKNVKKYKRVNKYVERRLAVTVGAEPAPDQDNLRNE